MNIRKAYHILLWVHAVYYLVTAVWGLADIDSFMAVTGPKADIWLVKTVSVLILPIVVSLVCGYFFNTHPVPVMLVAITAATGFAFIDFYYTANNTIRPVYTADGVVQSVLIIFWCVLLLQWRKISVS